MDVGLCLKNLPPGKFLEFVIEKEKSGKIRTVVSHNHGEVISEFPVGNDVGLKVGKLREREPPAEK